MSESYERNEQFADQYEAVLDHLHKISKILLGTPWRDFGKDFIQSKDILVDLDMFKKIYEFRRFFDDNPKNEHSWTKDLGLQIKENPIPTNQNVPPGTYDLYYDDDGYYYTLAYIAEAFHQGWKIIRSKDSNVIQLTKLLRFNVDQTIER